MFEIRDGADFQLSSIRVERVEQTEVSMNEITKSRTAMVIAAFAAIAYVIGSALEVAAYAALTNTDAATFVDLRHAADWLHFAGAAAAFVAVCVAGWELILAQRIAEVWEVGVAAVSTLLLVIGTLVNAASPSSGAGNVVGAIGVGGWSVLVLSRAARRSLIEREPGSAPPRQAVLWLMASAGLLLLAVGSGFTVGVTDQGLGIASGVLQALGVGAIAATLAAARSHHLLSSRSVPLVIAGLIVGAGAFVVAAIVAGIVFTPSGTLLQLRIGGSIATAVLLVGVALLGVAAWWRAEDIEISSISHHGQEGVPAPSWVPPGGHGPIETAPSVCASCGLLLGAGARFCQRCGYPVGPDPQR